MPEENTPYNIEPSIPEDNGEYPLVNPDPSYLDVKPFFSFEFFSDKEKSFELSRFEKKTDFHRLIEGLRTFCNTTWREIHTNSGFYHFHTINWGENSCACTRHQFEKCIHDPLVDFGMLDAFQFKAFQECRIVGFFNRKKNNCFEVVWIDRNHLLIPDQSRH